MGNVHAMKPPAHRQRHRVASNYLAQQNSSAWEDVKKLVLEEVGFNQLLTAAKNPTDGYGLAQAVQTVEEKL